MDIHHPADALRALCAAVRPHPAIPATHVTFLWEHGEAQIAHFDEADGLHLRGRGVVQTKPTPSAHARMAQAADIERLRPLFLDWVASMAAHPTYTHAAHRLGVRIGIDGTCHMLIDQWTHNPTTPHSGETWAQRLNEAAGIASDGTIHGCFVEGLFEGTAHLHPQTIAALGMEETWDGRRRVQVHPWMGTVAPPKKPQEIYATTTPDDRQRVRNLTKRITDAVRTWKGREMQPVMDIRIRDTGEGPSLHIHHVLAGARISAACSVAAWSASQKAPPNDWEAEVLQAWKDLWRELSSDAPILGHRSPHHPREGRFTPAHTTQGVGSLTLWGHEVGSGEKLLLARGLEPGPLQMAVSGHGAKAVPIASAQTRRFPRFVRALVAEGQNRPVHIFGPAVA